MSGLGNKEIMAKNLQYYMEKYDKDRNDICKDLNIPYTTFTEWVKGKSYPRIDKVELLANYFGIQKSDLIEESIEMKVEGYLLNSDAVALAQKYYENMELRILFDAVKKVKPEDVELVAEMVKRMSGD